MIIFRNVLILFIVLNLTIGKVNAEGKSQNYYRNFWSPTFHIQRLNYCTLGGKECGMPVARRYCQMMGYKEADKQIIDYNVGLTNYIFSKAQCKGWRCNGFKLIRCVGNISHKPPQIYYYRYRRFALPRMDHYRVDWCYESGKGCGRQAAHSFCRRMGYLRTEGYKKQERVPATKAIGNQKLCFGNQCTGFSEIICYR
ncbi:hypothetical protein [Legionella nagasakiensis]|uniref:hypothetical protein n=1 Tax=Legionella nagasakiensis TaxID=535290 RepID=UPI0010561A36|nr:hypothetical protein [Legionella nagasakiensis]